MKKLLALLLALVMTVCVFSACDKAEDSSKEEKESTTATDGKDKKEDKDDKDIKKDSKKSKKEDSDEDDVIETVENYLDTVFAGDEEAFDYVQEDSEAYYNTEDILESYNFFDEFVDNADIPEEYQDELDEVMKKVCKEVYKLVDYEIKDVTIKGNKATVDVKLTAPDFEGIGEVFEDLEGKMGDILLENFDKEELMDFENASIEEKGKFLIKVYGIVFDELISEIKRKKISEEGTFTLEKEKSGWVLVGAE